MYMHGLDIYTVQYTIRTRVESARRQHRKRTSETSDMVAYKDATKVVRKRWVNQHVKKVDTRAILLLIAANVILV